MQKFIITEFLWIKAYSVKKINFQLLAKVKIRYNNIVIDWCPINRSETPETRFSEFTGLKIKFKFPGFFFRSFFGIFDFSPGNVNFRNFENFSNHSLQFFDIPSFKSHYRPDPKSRWLLFGSRKNLIRSKLCFLVNFQKIIFEFY